MKEEKDVKNIQQFHVKNFNVKHNVDFNKLPKMNEEIDMVDFV